MHTFDRMFTSALLLLMFLGMGPMAFAQRDLTEIPDPDPESERNAMVIDAQANVNLFATDPQISKPIQMNFDSSGNLWVASSQVYPQIKPGEVADDKIIVLRDSDGDGVSDQRTVFARGLLIPTGVVPTGPHAAYVAESTRLLYLEDTDGDGVADHRRVVLSGFGTEDTHHLVHTLRMGPDGCLYFNQSIYIHSHIETPFGTRHLDGGGIWRYRPTNGRLEIVCKGFVNPWGHVFDAVGESFATDGAFFEGINYVFPDAVYVSSPGAVRLVKGLNPGSPKHCGLEVLSGTHIPPQWQGHLVTNDFRSHRVCRFEITPEASGYRSRQHPEIIRTQHVAFRPIDVRMGPDGALYVADWYNPIIQHGEVDFRDPRRDRTHGRIWRVSFPDRPLDHWPQFDQLDTDGLLQCLDDPSIHVRQFAREHLWQRVMQDRESVLAAMSAWKDAAMPQRELEWQWMQEVIEQPLTDATIHSIDDVAPDRKRTVLRSLWRRRVNLPEDARQQQSIVHWLHEFVLPLTQHDDPRVRLEAVVCAGQYDPTLGGSDAVVDAFNAVLQATEFPMDANLDFATWQAVRKLDAVFPGPSIIAAIDDWPRRTRQLAFAVRAIGKPSAAETAVALIQEVILSPSELDPLVDAIAASGDASQLGRAITVLLQRDPSQLTPQRMRPFLERTGRDKVVPSGIGKVLANIVQSRRELTDEQVQAIAQMASVWKTPELERPVLELLDQSLNNTDASKKIALIHALGAFHSPQARDRLDVLASDQDAQTRVAAVSAIASQRPTSSLPRIIGLLQDPATADAAIQIVGNLLARKALMDQLANQLTEARITPDVARRLLRRVRSGGGNPSLESAIQRSGQLNSASWVLTPELKQEILQAMIQNGSAERGEQVYRRAALQCIQCHAIGEAGGIVGPNLISTGGSSPPDYIIESLLDPSAKLKEGYTTLTVLTDEGEVINGIVIGRTDDHIQLRLADGKEVQIPIDSIEQEKPGKSLMPDGLLDSLTKQELIDLATFLYALGRDPRFTVSTDPLVRQYDSLIYSNEANRRLNRTSTDTAASDDPAMKWKPMTTLVDGRIPLSELDQFKQHRQTPPISFIRIPIDLASDGLVRLDLDPTGIEAWVDGKPTPATDLSELSLPAGHHDVVLSIDRSVRKEPFTIGLQTRSIN